MINKRNIGVLFVISSLLAGGASYMGYKYVRQAAFEQQYTSVLAIKKGKMISPYNPIIEADITLKDIPINQVTPGMITDPKLVVGKYTWVPMGEGEPVLDWKLTDGKLLPRKGEARYEIEVGDFTPMSEIRRGDTVKIWVKYRETDPERLVELGTPKFFKKTNDAADVLIDTQVVAVKDGSGAEVFSIQPIQANTQVVADLMDDKQVVSDTHERLSKTFRGQPGTMPSRLIFNWTEEQFKAFVEAKRFGEVQIGVEQYYKGDNLKKMMQEVSKH